MPEQPDSSAQPIKEVSPAATAKLPPKLRSRTPAGRRKPENGSDDPRLVPLLKALQPARNGDFEVRLKFRDDGILNDIALAFNEYVSINEDRVQELLRVSKAVGEEGRLTERARPRNGGSKGAWKTGIDAVNSLINSLVQPTTE